MKKQGVLLVTVLLLTGCGFRGVSESPPPPSLPTPEMVKPSVPPPVTEIPPLPPIRSFDWLVSLKPLVNQILFVVGIPAGSVLLVDNVQNKTNGDLLWANATIAIKDILQQGDKFQLVSNQQLLQAKQSLGLSVDDSLGSRSKAIGLARHLNAQYVLYSTVMGDVDSPEIRMQLMLVRTGEIVWSGADVVIL